MDPGAPTDEVAGSTSADSDNSLELALESSSGIISVSLAEVLKRIVLSEFPTVEDSGRLLLLSRKIVPWFIFDTDDAEELRLLMWQHLCKQRWRDAKVFAEMKAISGTADWERMFRMFLPRCPSPSVRPKPEEYSFLFSLQDGGSCVPISLVEIKGEDALTLLSEGNTGWLNLDKPIDLGTFDSLEDIFVVDDPWEVVDNLADARLQRMTSILIASRSSGDIRKSLSLSCGAFGPAAYRPVDSIDGAMHAEYSTDGEKFGSSLASAWFWHRIRCSATTDNDGNIRYQVTAMMLTVSVDCPLLGDPTYYAGVRTEYSSVSDFLEASGDWLESELQSDPDPDTICPPLAEVIQSIVTSGYVSVEVTARLLLLVCKTMPRVIFQTDDAEELRLLVWRRLCKLRWLDPEEDRTPDQENGKDLAKIKAISGTMDWERMFRKFLPRCPGSAVVGPLPKPLNSSVHLPLPENYSFMFMLQDGDSCAPISIVEIKPDDTIQILNDRLNGWLELDNPVDLGTFDSLEDIYDMDGGWAEAKYNTDVDARLEMMTPMLYISRSSDSKSLILTSCFYDRETRCADYELPRTTYSSYGEEIGHCLASAQFFCELLCTTSTDEGGKIKYQLTAMRLSIEVKSPRDTLFDEDRNNDGLLPQSRPDSIIRVLESNRNWE